MEFFLNKNLVFIDSMQFMNYSLKDLVKNLSDNDFKYLTDFQIFQIFQIFDENYLTCNKIWNKFSMKNMSDYHDHYFRKDVLLLADVFEKFIDMCLNIYGLDPCYYFSSSGLSWDVILKMTGMRLNCRH